MIGKSSSSAYLSERAGQYFKVDTCTTRLQHAPAVASHVVVLDLMLPGEDDLSLCRWLRAESDIPILILTARCEPTDRIIGLELVADDGLVVPLSIAEFRLLWVFIERPRRVLSREQLLGAAEQRKAVFVPFFRPEGSCNRNSGGWGQIEPGGNSRRWIDGQDVVSPCRSRLAGDGGFKATTSLKAIIASKDQLALSSRRTCA